MQLSENRSSTSVSFSGPEKYFATASEWALAIYIAVLPLMQWTLLEQFDSTAVVSDAVFLVACIAFVAALLRGELTWRPSGLYVVLGFYATALLLSTLAAQERSASAGKLFIEAYLLTIAILTFNVVRSDRTLKLVVQAWMVGTGLTVIAGIAGVILFYCNVRNTANIFLSGYGTLFPGNYPRILGLFLNMNMCCNYLSVSFLFLLAMRSVGWIGRRAAVILGAAIVVTAAFTVSPGLGGLALGAGLWFWAAYRERCRCVAARNALLAGIIIALVFVVAMLVSPPSLFGPDGRLQFSHMQPSGRVLCWRSALHTAWRHPWLGDGPGSLPASVDYPTASGERQHLGDAHNTLLSIAAKDGILGLVAFSAILIFLLRKTHLQTRGSPKIVFRTAAWIGLLQAMVYQGLGGSWEHTRYIWVLIGVMAALRSEKTYDSGRPLEYEQYERQ